MVVHTMLRRPTPFDMGKSMKHHFWFTKAFYKFAWICTTEEADWECPQTRREDEWRSVDGTCQLGATARHSSRGWSHHMVRVQLSAHEWRLAETTSSHRGFTSLSRQSSLSIHDKTCNATHYAGKIVPESRSDWGYWCWSATLCYSKATTVDISRKCGGEINW